jgi:hypothetical protein
VGRAVPPALGGGLAAFEDRIPGLDDTTAPLVLAVPPGSHGIEVLGHRGTVLCRPIPDLTDGYWPGAPWDRFHFTPPHIGLDGRFHSD